MTLAGMMTSGGGQILADGTFTIGGVTPGRYTLRASPQGQSDEVALMEISVAGSDIADLQVVSAKPSSIRGRVVFEPGAVKPPAASAVRLTASHTNVFGTMPGNATPKDDWTFEMKVGAGHVLIRANVFGTGDWRVNRVIANDTDVIDGGIDIPANATIENVVVEMTTRHAEISVTVTDAAGALVRDCVVVVFVQDPQRWTSQTRYVVSSRPDQENLFHVRLSDGRRAFLVHRRPGRVPALWDPARSVLRAGDVAAVGAR